MQSKSTPFVRYEGNPVVTREDIPYPCNTVFNAAACKFDGQYILLLRVEDLRGHSHITLARSRDGYGFTVEPSPWILPSKDPDFEIHERYGIEDPRITVIEDTYYLTYTAYGFYGPRIGIGKIIDFVEFERIAIIEAPDNKDAVLFPEKIKGHFALLDRPGGLGGTHGAIWINYSPDLIYWRKAGVILSPEPGWGPSKIGMCIPPIKTGKGWLGIYHGVRETGSGRIYRVGAILFDLDCPEKIIGYTPHFIFGPEAYYERAGDVPNVVFPCGAVIEEDGMIKMYYGAADTCIALAEAHIEDIISGCTQGAIAH
jgi:predicted GH43/DUF377 family glycosyl hydrolase